MEHHIPATHGIAAPSVLTRAVVVVVLLIGFYVSALVLVAMLLALPVAAYFLVPHTSFYTLLLLAAAGWIPAVMLFISMFGARVPKFTPPGRRLARDEAPAFFEMVEELARAAGTAPPGEVYVVPSAELAVVEVRRTRILIIGAPMLAWISVDELRAGIAHELGHFSFGDTRLGPLISYAHSAFRAVLTRTQKAPISERNYLLFIGFSVAQWVGHTFTTSYAKLFFFITRKSDRAAELAADHLAARLSGSASVVSLLDKLRIGGPLYAAYLDEVIAAIEAGAIPTDLIEGYAVFAQRLKERGVVAELETASRQDVSIYDTHPPAIVRSAALRQLNHEVLNPDPRLASSLFTIDLESAFVEDWHRKILPDLPAGSHLGRMKWAEMPKATMVPHAFAKARELAQSLYRAHPGASTFASMFTVVASDVSVGRWTDMVRFVEPRIDVFVPADRAMLTKAIGENILTSLFVAALLERGAELHLSLGEIGYVLSIDEKHICPREVASKAADDGRAVADLVSWGRYLEGKPLVQSLASPGYV